MPTQRFSHLLKPLLCSEQDDANLRELAETLVLHNIDQFNALELGATGAPANKNRWKEIRKKEGTKIFKERATMGEPLEMPSLMLLGTVVGKLEDFIPSAVRVYARGFFDFKRGRRGKNELINNAALTATAVQWLSFPRKVECAQLKKLLWTMHKNNNRESILSLTSEEGKSKKPTTAPTPGLCKVCSKSFGFLGTSRKSCKACNYQICARCSVIKTVVMLAPNKVSMIEKKRAFCVQCINDVVRTDASRIAREEILNAGKQVAAYF
ncbi:hypothetical protein PRIC2_013961 [Phytophthora ramorum]